MPVKQTLPFNYGSFFITFTCHKWLPLIDKVNGYDIVYNWFNILKSNGHFWGDAPSPAGDIAEKKRKKFDWGDATSPAGDVAEKNKSLIGVTQRPLRETLQRRK